jgi:ribulose-5-phosphate 4-epimerase/fuculose-1-phosphate aldolase
MLLRNHGTLSVGATAAEAWLGIFFLERACKQQVMALTAGRQRVLLAPEQAQETVRRQASAASFGKLALLAWPGLLRKVDRHLPGYDA